MNHINYDRMAVDTTVHQDEHLPDADDVSHLVRDYTQQ